MNAEKLEQPVAGWCAGCDTETALEYNDGGTLVCGQCLGPAAREAAADSAQPPVADKTVFACSALVLALEAIYAAIVDMEEFVNSSTHIHYNRRAQLRAKTSAVKEAVQMVRQNGEHSNTPKQNA